MIVLEVLSPDGVLAERRLSGETCVVGRSSSADLSIPDRALSRTHARLFRDAETWLVEDMGSRNGTRLNQRPLLAPAVLQPGDVIELGGSRLTVRRTEHGGPPTQSSGVSGATLFRPAREVLAEQSSGRQLVGPGEAGPLDRLVQRLKLLNEVHDALGRSVELPDLLRLILDRAFTHLGPEEGAIFLKTPDGSYTCVASRSARSNGDGSLFSQNLLHQVAENGMAALVLDTLEDERFNQAKSLMNAGLRSLVAAPLLDPDGALGMMVLGSRLQVRQFSEEDMELLVSLASVAAMRIRNLRLAEGAAERRRLQQEVELARRIQVGLLPRQLPTVAGCELHAGNIPSRWVSGDFYTVQLRREGRELLLQVADVSGKGIAAALLTASLEALGAAPIAAGVAPDELCSQVSHLLLERTPPEKYATAIVAALDLDTYRLSFANAGHTPGLLLRRDGAVEWLRSTGPPIGLLPDATYTAGTAELGPGDLLVTYTDGITEATDPDDEEYGAARLEAVCLAHRDGPLPALAAAVERDLEHFVRRVPFADDRTILLLRRSPEGMASEPPN